MDPARSFAQRFGADVARCGATALPRCVLRQQAALGLTPPQPNVILHILAYKWSAEPALPWPETALTEMGSCWGQVQQIVRSPEQRGSLGGCRCSRRRGRPQAGRREPGRPAAAGAAAGHSNRTVRSSALLEVATGREAARGPRRRRAEALGKLRVADKGWLAIRIHAPPEQESRCS
jgi:hypothetical protein